MERAKLEGARGHPLGPGAIEPDQELRGGIGLAGDLEQPGGHADLVFFGHPQDIGRARPVDQVPERDLAPIPGDRLADDVDGHAQDRVEVARPEPDPVGQGARPEVDQRAGLDGELLPGRPDELGVEVFPADASPRSAPATSTGNGAGRR